MGAPASRNSLGGLHGRQRARELVRSNHDFHGRPSYSPDAADLGEVLYNQSYSRLDHHSVPRGSSMTVDLAAPAFTGLRRDPAGAADAFGQALFLLGRQSDAGSERGVD